MQVWLSETPVFLAAVAILLLPGLTAGVALGLRGFALVALAPAFTVTVVAAASLANHLVDYDWGPWPLVVATAVVSGLVLGLRLLWQKRWQRPAVGPAGRLVSLATLIGLVFAFGAIAVRFASIFGAPSRVSQTFDNVYHLNAIRWILDTGIVSPFKVGSLNYQFDERISFYPDMWHALVALAVQATGAPIPVAVNVVNIAIAGIVWPLACVFLVRQIAGPRPVALLAAGVLSASFAAFPYLMVDFGVLYPNLLSISLLPAALAAVVLVARAGADDTLTAPVRWVVLVGVLPGLALAHPTTLMALVAFSLPIGVAVVVRHLRQLRDRRAPRSHYLRAFVIAAAAFGAAAVALLLIRPPGAAFWPPRESLIVAVHGALAGAAVARPADYVVGVLLVVGVIAVVRRRFPLWLVGSYALAAGLYIIVASFPQGPLRTGFTGVWYNDSFRIAAMLPVLVLPLAALGVVRLTDLLTSAIGRWRQARGDRNSAGVSTVALTPFAMATGAALVVALGLSTQLGPALAFAMRTGQYAYKFTSSSPLLSPDERALLERVSSEVPEEATVVGSPWTGASLVYALSDRRALLPHIYGERDEATLEIVESLRDAAPGDEVCGFVEELDAYYVLDFGDREINGGDPDAEVDYSGLENLGESAAVELVDSEGDARLYRVTACG